MNDGTAGLYCGCLPFEEIEDLEAVVVVAVVTAGAVGPGFVLVVCAYTAVDYLEFDGEHDQHDLATKVQGGAAY